MGILSLWLQRRLALCEVALDVLSFLRELVPVPCAPCIHR